MIKGYIQELNGKVVARWKPNEIFHLPWNRIGAEVHGHGDIEQLDWTMKAMAECSRDLKVIFHRYVKPLWVFSVGTDDDTEISNLKSDLKKTLEKAENLIVPKDIIANIDRVSIPQYSTLDPYLG